MRVSLPYDKPIVAAVKVRGGMGSGLMSIVLCVYPVFLILLSASLMAAPARTGLRAVAQIFAPHLFLPLLLLVPFAFRRGAGRCSAEELLVVCAVLFGARYMPAFASSPPASDPAATRLSVMTWNVFAESRSRTTLVRFLLTKPADVVVLQEVSWAWLTGDKIATTYPYQLIDPDETAPGMAILRTLIRSLIKEFSTATGICGIFRA